MPELISAVRDGKLDKARKLLQEGVNPEACGKEAANAANVKGNQHDNKAMHWAVLTVSLESVRALFQLSCEFAAADLTC